MLVARFGKKNLYQYCGLFTVVGGVGLFFVPGNLPLLALVLHRRSRAFGVQLINTLMFALEADTVEYGEWKTGQRTEGATYAIFSFTRKITQSIGGALGAFALAIGGYITKLAAGQVQPDSAITAIKASIGLVPAAAAILAMLAFIAYPLTEKKYRDIVAENDDRKQAIPGEAELRHRADPAGHRLTVPRSPHRQPHSNTERHAPWSTCPRSRSTSMRRRSAGCTTPSRP